jgi:hypothetical protein
MIRTKEPQVVDAMNRESAVVYMEACNRRESKEAQTVTFDVFMYTIESVTRVENVNVLKTRLDGETGETVNYYEAEERTVTRPFLKIISKRDAIYKMSTLSIPKFGMVRKRKRFISGISLQAMWKKSRLMKCKVC